MSTSERILLLEPNRYHALLLRRELERQLPSVVLAHFREPAPAIIEAGKSAYSVCLVAHSERGHHAEASVKRLRELAPALPIIVLADGATMLFVQHLEELGITEVIIKDDTFSQVVPRLVAALLNRDRKTSTNPEQQVNPLSDISKEHALRDELEQSAVHIHSAICEILTGEIDCPESLRASLLAIDRDALEIRARLRRQDHNWAEELDSKPTVFAAL